ncbi:MAG TPA: hypothetical protein VKD04_03520 [Burkholderiales bacterium]|nr:hypothetical protein [Burkholderiales bacterium]
MPVYRGTHLLTGTRAEMQSIGSVMKSRFVSLLAPPTPARGKPAAAAEKKPAVAGFIQCLKMF